MSGLDKPRGLAFGPGGAVRPRPGTPDRASLTSPPHELATNPGGSRKASNLTGHSPSRTAGVAARPNERWTYGTGISRPCLDFEPGSRPLPPGRSRRRGRSSRPLGTRSSGPGRQCFFSTNGAATAGAVALLPRTKWGRGSRSTVRSRYRVGRRSHEQKVKGSNHQEMPASGHVLRRSRRVLGAGYPLGGRRHRRTTRLLERKRPANAGLFESG
jgi:hypothetical protein